jgi:hypothetical protein
VEVFSVVVEDGEDLDQVPVGSDGVRDFFNYVLVTTRQTAGSW